MEFLKISYDKFHQDTINLVNNVMSANPDIKYVWGPARGGYLPAIIASHFFNLQYKDLGREQVQDGGKDFLIIDDVNDTGKTFKDLKVMFPNAVFASLYKKGRTEFCDAYYAEEYNNTWLVFPFEDEEKAKADYEGYCGRRDEGNAG